jgi:hypothetical protein
MAQKTWRIIKMVDELEFEDYLQTDDAIFHYTTLGTGLELILPSKQLRLSSLQNTNDPQEYKFLLLNATANGNILNSIQDMINKEHTELDRVLRFKSRAHRIVVWVNSHNFKALEA